MKAWSRSSYLLLPLLWLGFGPGRGQERTVVEVFVLDTCPHCAAALMWLEGVRAERPDVEFRLHVVNRDPAARDRLIGLAREHGLTVVGVPVFLIGDRLLVGWQGPEVTGAEILGAIAAAGARAPPPSPVEAAADTEAVRVPVLGTLSPGRLGLPLFTVALGLVDGFNPCAMWALLLILAILLRLRDRRRMLVIGGTFIAVGGLLYFVFLAAWLEFFLLVGFSRALQVGLGLVALAIGAVNLKDVVAFRQGPSLGIPERARPGIYARIRGVLSAPTLPLALVAVGLLSAVVNLLELLCTAGLPAVYTHVLGSYDLGRPAYYGYLLLYVGAYILDDGLMLALAVITLTETRLQERAGRWLKLVSGVMMAGLGLILLLRPAWLLGLG
jgi:glutaredoxin